MSDALEPIPPTSVELLLRLLEAPEPILAGVQLTLASHDHDLLKKGLLHEAGVELISVTEDDLPVPVTRCPDRGGYGYFSTASGWVPVPEYTLRRYRLDVPRLLEVITSALARPLRRVPTELEEEFLWNLGDVRLPGRAALMSVWFARRLFDPSIWRAVSEKHRSRPPLASASF